MHQYIAAVEQGQIALEKLRLFAGEQYSIITSDLRSVAFLLGRHGNLPSRTYLLTTLQGEAAAHTALLNFAGALGMDEQELERYEPLPGCQAYTAYVAWLALYGSEAELATAFVVNLPVWGLNCGRMSSALQLVYRLDSKAVAFFDLFAQVPREAGEEVLSVIQQGLDRGIPVQAITRAARLIQAYELMFLGYALRSFDEVNETFSTRVRKVGNSIWEAQHLHPFVRGIAEGTLDLERFRFWVRQDYLFLIEYSRLLALAAARAPGLQTIERFVELANATLTVEMELHRNYASEFGIAQEELDSELMVPTTRAYTDFLLRTAALGDFAELAAALLPCMWGFAEIGERLSRGHAPDDPRYAAWIEMYASVEFQGLASWCRDLVDNLAAGAGDETLRRMQDAFITSSQYEYLFWEMAWRLEGWRV